MKNPIHFRSWLAASSLLFIATVLAAEPTNLSQLKREIVTYVESGDYEREMAAAAAPAAKFIVERAARRTAPERLAIVLDIDETVLSNLPTMRETDFGYLPAVWDKWIERAAAPAIAPMLAVFQAARKAGVEVIFITGRHENNRTGTVKNLQEVGMGDYAALFFKPEDARNTTEKFKTETRRKLAGEGWVIIANIGDQAGDLAGGFAEKTFKLPDPFYQTE